MDPVTEAKMFAQTFFVGSPQHVVAVAICQTRNVNPDYPSGAGVPNWQAVLMEQFLLDALGKMIK